MNIKTFAKEMLPKITAYKLARSGLASVPNPITLTFSVTNLCQSRCYTCRIWELYKDNPEKIKEELRIDEIERIFKSMGHIFFLNISGGEPFLRDDLPRIIELAMIYLKPCIIHIPTNAIASEIIEKQTKAILGIISKFDFSIPLTIKPSFDGIGDDHDRIRGIKGNFERVLDTVSRLKKINQCYPNLHIELGTVISNKNIDKISQIADYAHSLGIESYRNEIAEQRAEFFNKQDPITPKPQIYETLVKGFGEKIRENIKGKRKLTKFTEALRLVYYDVAAKIMKERRQVIPCFAGISNVHLNPYGEIWPCCVLGYDKPMGNLRDVNYDFKKAWHSKQAADVRRFIKQKKCWCPLANQAYSNILCHARTLVKAMSIIIKDFK